MKNKQKIIAVLIVVLIGLAAGIAYYLLRSENDEITATGTIEVTRADIMPKTNGYLTNLELKSGDKVEAGQVVATISRPDLYAQVLRDEAALERAKAQLNDLMEGPRKQEKTEIAANLAAAKSVYEKTSLDYQRYLALYNKGAISEQQLDAARSARDVAYNQVVALEQRLNLSDEGTRRGVIEAQRLEVERSQAILDASKILLKDTVLVSPISGLILSKNYENGEYVNPGTAIYTIGDMNDCWVKIYVPSTMLGRIRLGQGAQIKIDSFPERVFDGVIKEISQNAEFTPRQSITKNERANLVFAVKVKVNNSEGILKPGMPADVVIK